MVLANPLSPWRRPGRELGLSRRLDKAWFAETRDRRRPLVPWPASSELWIWGKAGMELGLTFVHMPEHLGLR